ncbi:holo-ACP synthase [Aliidiomarina sedimenti]|uniref:Holo-[acyl-carrier-protein] synthase n=1 Tax=Aliidiomarina sedimenti TaxID=1933879 RepID=A0ABY0C2T3_9GAMM|nr:holo-ACP synthase [Aliidiomarina sedimenti]RUO31963.1 holo-ACP synthase [Aliidiomarina sedimenti]
MSVLGIGTDIVSIERIAGLLQRNPAFAERVLTPTERATFAQHSQPVAFLAKRWAAKEATAKALGTGIGQVSFQHIEVTRLPSGQPQLQLHGAAQAQATALGATQFHLSLSDEREFAIAYVVLSAI